MDLGGRGDRVGARLRGDGRAPLLSRRCDTGDLRRPNLLSDQRPHLGSGKRPLVGVRLLPWHRGGVQPLWFRSPSRVPRPVSERREDREELRHTHPAIAGGERSRGPGVHSSLWRDRRSLLFGFVSHPPSAAVGGVRCRGPPDHRRRCEPRRQDPRPSHRAAGCEQDWPDAGSSGTRGYAAFGLAYGLASLGCALPLFLALLGTAIAVGGPWSAVVAFALYGIGMATTLGVLTLVAGIVSFGVLVRVRALGPFVSKLGSVLLLVSGAYVVYYWLTAGRFLFA